MKKNNTKITGLYVSGTVQDRTRRMVPIANPTTEIVNYDITDDSGKHYFVDDYAPSTYYEISEFVELPVYVKPYQKKDGKLSYSLSVQKSRGEKF